MCLSDFLHRLRVNGETACLLENCLAFGKVECREVVTNPANTGNWNVAVVCGSRIGFIPNLVTLERPLPKHWGVFVLDADFECQQFSFYHPLLNLIRLMPPL
jgi:hypothetical protein